MSTATAKEEPPESGLPELKSGEPEKINKHVLDASGLERCIGEIVGPMIDDMIERSIDDSGKRKNMLRKEEEIKPGGVKYWQREELLTLTGKKHEEAISNSDLYIERASLIRDALEVIRDSEVNKDNKELRVVIESLLDRIYNPNRISILGASPRITFMAVAIEIIDEAKMLLDQKVFEAKERDSSLVKQSDAELNDGIDQLREKLADALAVSDARRAGIDSATNHDDPQKNVAEYETGATIVTSAAS